MLHMHQNSFSDQPPGDKRYARLRHLIEQAKELLPLRQLIQEEGDAGALNSNRCPFHLDNKPSFSVFLSSGSELWKCHAGCGQGDQINYLEVKYACSRGQAIAMFLKMAGLQGEGGGTFNQ